MRLSLRTKYLSQPRYNRYLIATGNDLTKAKQLYHANIRLTQAFHPLLSQFEVILRNSLNQVMILHFGDEDWIINQKNEFMNDRSLGQNKYLKGKVVSSKTKMRRNKTIITSGKVIADQPLGFWVALFSKPYYKLLEGRPIHIFPNKPSMENRSSLHQKLEMLRNFRNRVSHCEPLCFRDNAINCDEAIRMKSIIFELTEWIEPRLIPFLTTLDNVDSQIKKIIRIKPD